MPFEFYCPQGHLLEGDDEQLGTQGRCPLCGTLFMFPKSAGVGAAGARSRGASSSGGAAAQEPIAPQVAVPEPRVLQVLCPRGHALETPEEMLGTEVICPQCRTQFVPTVERSVAYLRHKQRYENQKEDAKGRFWIAIAVVATAIVVVTLIGMGVYLKRRG
ncbi:MAG: hypothetical protein K8U03_21320 [Planctomycetia bacterium]|nr:hypothetical protein [Planctomycetia bacterium]